MARRSASYMSRWSYLEAKIDWDMAKGWYKEKETCTMLLHLSFSKQV